MYSWPYLGRRVIQTHINHQKESVLTLHPTPMILPDYMWTRWEINCTFLNLFSRFLDKQLPG